LAGSLEDNWEPQPEEVVELKSRVEEVRAAMEVLSPTYRIVLMFYLFDGLSYREIAARLGQPVGSIRTSVSRSMKLLRERLAANVD